MSGEKDEGGKYTPDTLAALKEALAILEIYYKPNSDGSRPTIDMLRRVIAREQRLAK